MFDNYADLIKLVKIIDLINDTAMIGQYSHQISGQIFTILYKEKNELSCPPY